MSRIAATLAMFICCIVVAAEPADDLARVEAAAAEARRAAVAAPQVTDVASAPVRAYLAEQQRRRLLRLVGLRQRIDEYRRDVTKESLLPVLKQQLTELESKPLEPVSFDGAYGYQPTTGLLGYSKKVRLLENTSDGKSIILVDNAALVVTGLGTSEYASGKFFGIEQAILVGAQQPDYVFRGQNKKTYAATLVNLEALLQPDRKTP